MSKPSESAESIQNGKVVQLAYSLKNDNGELLDSAESGDPFVYLHGSSQVVPGLETGLEGLKVGDKKSVVVQPSEGYGEIDPELKLTVKRSQFPATVKLEAGMQFESRPSGESDGGHGLVFTVDAIEGENVRIDGNHPLAGQTLTFSVEVLSIRDATDEEKEHGHAHGEHGHGHSH